jgi:hypothetical protein
MINLEQLLVPGSTELPDCRCGRPMAHVTSSQNGDDAEIRSYRCAACGHEMKLTVWLEPIPRTGRGAGRRPHPLAVADTSARRRASPT